MNQKILKNTGILTAITVISGLLLGFVYEITKEPIEVSRENRKQEAYQTVLEEADCFEPFEAFEEKEAETILQEAGISGCYVNEAAVAFDDGQNVIGSVVTATSKEGYGGEIKVAVGITADGTVKGIELLSISETAGLGMNAQEPEFKEQFQNVNTDRFEVVKGNGGKDGKIDALSGATITTDAVTNAVNAAVSYYHGAMEGGSIDE